MTAKPSRKRYYDHREELRLAKRATRHLAAAIRQMDARLVELRQEIAALRKGWQPESIENFRFATIADYPDLSPIDVEQPCQDESGCSVVGCGPLSDPLKERIEQIEDRLSVERRMP